MSEVDNDKLDKVNERLMEILVEIGKISTLQAQHMGQISEIFKRVNELETKPAKKTEHFINVIIAAVTSGVIGYLISQVLK